LSSCAVEQLSSCAVEQLSSGAVEQLSSQAGTSTKARRKRVIVVLVSEAMVFREKVN
jgi:hypothetical protein